MLVSKADSLKVQLGILDIYFYYHSSIYIKKSYRKKILPFKIFSGIIVSFFNGTEERGEMNTTNIYLIIFPLFWPPLLCLSSKFNVFQIRLLTTFRHYFSTNFIISRRFCDHCIMNLRSQ